MDWVNSTAFLSRFFLITPRLILDEIKKKNCAAASSRISNLHSLSYTPILHILKRLYQHFKFKK